MRKKSEKKAQIKSGKPPLKKRPKSYTLKNKIMVSFGRHRTVTTEEKKPIVKTEIKKEPEKKPDPIIEAIKEVFPTAHVEEIKKEEIKPLQKKNGKKKKKRIDLKPYNNVGIVGDTIEVKDFRAIIKKKGDQINTVLTGILHKWNKENYNL